MFITDSSTNTHHIGMNNFTGYLKSLPTTGKTNLKILYININRLKNKLDRLETFLYSTPLNIDIIILVETFLYGVNLSSINLSGYKVNHQVRKGRDGGGISIFVRQSLDFHFIEGIEDNENEFLILKSGKLNLHIVGVYKPPHTKVFEFLHSLNGVMEKYQKALFVGDFNINVLKDLDPDTLSYNSVIEANGYSIINYIDPRFVTRISNTIHTILDHLLSSSSVAFKYSILYDDTDLSDHRYLVINCQTPSIVSNQAKITTVMDYNAINKFITSYNFSNFEFKVFYTNLITKLNSSTITVCHSERKQSFRNPWLNAKLKGKIKVKEKYFKLYISK